MINDTKPDPFCQRVRNLLSQKLISCIENIPKLELGAAEKIHLEFEDYQLVKFMRNPKLIVTVVASTLLDTGSLFSLENEVAVISGALQECID